MLKLNNKTVQIKNLLGLYAVEYDNDFLYVDFCDGNLNIESSSSSHNVLKMRSDFNDRKKIYNLSKVH